MKKIIYTSSAILLASALIISCGKKEESVMPMDEMNAMTVTADSDYPAEGMMHIMPIVTPAGQEFTLVMNQEPWANYTMVEKKPSFMIDAEGKVSGFSGVNRIMGNAMINTSDAGLQFEGLAGTRMAGAPEAMELEHKFLEALGKATYFEYVGNILKLKDSEGVILAEFQHPVN